MVREVVSVCAAYCRGEPICWGSALLMVWTSPPLCRCLPPLPLAVGWPTLWLLLTLHCYWFDALSQMVGEAGGQRRRSTATEPAWFRETRSLSNSTMHCSEMCKTALLFAEACPADFGTSPRLLECIAWPVQTPGSAALVPDSEASDCQGANLHRSGRPLYAAADLSPKLSQQQRPAMDAQQLRATRIWVQKQFQTSGLQLEPAALEELVRAVQDVPDPEEYVHSLIEEVETGEWRVGAAGPTPTGGGRRRQLRPPALQPPCAPAAASCSPLSLPAPPLPQLLRSGWSPGCCWIG